MVRRSLIIINMKKVFVLFLIALPLFSFANQRINVSSKISIELPDDMQRFDAKKDYIYYDGACKDFSLLVFAIEKKSGSWNPDIMDKTFVPGINPDSLISKKQEMPFRLSRDWIKKTYRMDSLNFLTFSSHTYSTIYTFVFITKEESNLKKIDQTIGTIEYKRGFLESGFHAFNCGKTIWIVLLLIVSGLSIVLHESGESFGERIKKISIMTFFEMLVLLIPLWGYWAALIFFSLVIFVINSIGCFTGIYWQAGD